MFDLFVFCQVRISVVCLLLFCRVELKTPFHWFVFHRLNLQEISFRFKWKIKRHCRYSSYILWRSSVTSILHGWEFWYLYPYSAICIIFWKLVLELGCLNHFSVEEIAVVRFGRIGKDLPFSVKKGKASNNSRGVCGLICNAFRKVTRCYVKCKQIDRNIKFSDCLFTRCV